MKKITPDSPYAQHYDLNNCDKEPIAFIQTIQSFASILAVDAEGLIIRQVSDNTLSYLGISPEELLGQPLHSYFSKDIIDQVKKGLALGNFLDINPILLPLQIQLDGQKIMVAHLHQGQLILEIEDSPLPQNDIQFINKIDTAISNLQNAPISDPLYNILAEEVKNVTGYDRVMVYRFTKEYHGEVIAEAKEEHLDSFLGLRYPSTDIPQQARALFLTNRLRMLVDVDDQLSMVLPSLHPISQQPLNVGRIAARGVSPIHLEYLQNMGVKATLNVAIVEDEKLWGLIACHHYTKKVLDFRTRTLSKFMGQIMSGHLSLWRASNYREMNLQADVNHAKLIERMNQERDLFQGLTTGQPTIQDYIPSVGAAIIFSNQIKTIGQTPTEAALKQLITWLDRQEKGIVFSNHQLQELYPPAANFSPPLAGLLSVRLSAKLPEYLLWFRQAEVQEVYWGGNPEKTIVKKEGQERLSPRASFSKWKQVIKNNSLLWTKEERDAALMLRNNIQDIILVRFDELNRLNKELQKAYRELEQFSYTVSHDLKSPLRGIQGFAKILKEDYTSKLDDYGVEIIDTIISSSERMNTFINDILRLSKLAKYKLVPTAVDPNPILSQIIREATPNQKEKYPVKIIVPHALPDIYGDRTMIQQVFGNLIDNALKYGRPIPDAQVVVSAKEAEGKTYFSIKDNGIGFEMDHAGKIFDVFSRLVGEEYEGTGIGLSVVKQIVERHSGEIKVNSIKGEGTEFVMILPQQEI